MFSIVQALSCGKCTSGSLMASAVCLCWKVCSLMLPGLCVFLVEEQGWLLYPGLKSSLSCNENIVSLS